MIMMPRSFSQSQRLGGVFDSRILSAILGLVWLSLFLYFRKVSYFDPSSAFFRYDDAYRPLYSDVREKDADRFLAAIDDSFKSIPETSPKFRLKASDGKSQHGDAGKVPFCLGIPTLRREQGQYVSRTVASLVDSLTAEERELLHIVILMSDDDPTANTAFGQTWLHALVDSVLVHEGADASLVAKNNYQTIPKLPANTPRDEHVRRDYVAMVAACRKRNAEYFILVEDDIIAARGWLGRLRTALPEVNAGVTSSSKADWLYLRLFYSEIYLGWNSEEWFTYARNIVFVYVAATAILIAIRRIQSGPTPLPLKDRTQKTTSRPSRFMPISIFIFWIPAFIVLYFRAGRLVVSPLSTGVQEMPRYGCCSQGLVMPARHFEILEKDLLTPPFDVPADSTIELTAERRGLAKWALVPSVFQHVGVRGSSIKGATRKLTWNFSFERVFGNGHDES